MNSTGVHLALDIGGSKIAAAIVNSTGTLSDIRQCPTPTHRVWAACSELLSNFPQFSKIGISSAGPLNTITGVVYPVNIPEWSNGFPLLAHMEQLSPQAQVHLAGDGSCAALAEQRLGAAHDTQNMLAIVLSTGVGAGIILHGQPVLGSTGNAGHIGHIRISGGSEICACGARGCLETVASGPAAVRWARQNGWGGSSAEELSMDYGSLATQALTRAGTAVGQALVGAAALLDIDVVVIGGGFSQAGPRLWEAISNATNAHAQLYFLRNLSVRPAKFMGLSSLIGAGQL
ncbi:MAG: ROK family protein [Mycobacteriaceae bacterium]